MKDYIDDGENLKTKPIDLSIKNKQIAFCPELPFGILSFSRFVDIEAMNIISFNIEMNESKVLGTKSKKLVNALKQLGMPHVFRLFKQLKEEGKIKPDDILNKLSKYIKLNKKD